ncbi:MAG: hypothetical protein PF447_06060 [Spirochaetaceae bacterium]|jgi:hypothetical protein|nr:hypothetical protein [Spirochaetaceae bacterium]
MKKIIPPQINFLWIFLLILTLIIVSCDNSSTSSLDNNDENTKGYHADISGPETVYVGQPVTYSAVESDNSNGYSFRRVFDYQQLHGENNINHTFLESGEEVLILQVYDGLQEVYEATQNITVLDRNPNSYSIEHLKTYNSDNTPQFIDTNNSGYPLTVYDIYIDDDFLVLSGSNRILVSNDNGTSWTQYALNKPTSVLKNITFDTTNSRFYFSNSGYTNDGYEVFYLNLDTGEILSVMNGHHANDILIDDNKLYVGTSDGLYIADLTSPGAVTFYAEFNDLVATRVHSISKHNETLVFSVKNYVVQTNIDEINFSHSAFLNYASEVYDFYVDQHFFLTKDNSKFCFSIDGGYTWKYDSNLYAESLGDFMLSENGDLFVFTSYMNLLISSDNGVSWTSHTSNYDGNDYTSVKLYNNKLYIGSYNRLSVYQLNLQSN